MDKRKRWKLTALIIIIICLAVFQDTVQAKQVPINLTSEEQAYVKSHGPVRMCVDPDWFPYEAITDDGQYWGIAADLIGLISERTGLQMKLIPTPDWDESLAYMKSGKCDIVSLLNATDERKQWMNFTDPYFTDPNVLITRNEHDYISDPARLSGETVVLPSGTSIEERLRRDYPNMKIVLVTSEREAMDYVSDGKADLTVRSLTMSAYTIRQEGLFNLKISGQINDYENKLCIGVSKDDPMLLQILNKGIASLTQEEVQAAINHYIPMEIRQGVNYRLIVILSGVFLFLLSAGILWIIMLRRFNKRLTQQKEELEAVYGQLEASEALYKSFLNASPDAVVISEVSGTILMASPAAYTLVGMHMGEQALPGHKLTEFICEEDRERLLHSCAGLYDGRKTDVSEYRGVCADGQEFIMEVKSEAINNKNKRPDRIVSIIRNITERRKMEAELQKNAAYDKLTGIRNRSSLEMCVLEQIGRHTGEDMSLMLFDFDHFKLINDTYGHNIGDEVLKHITKTVQGCIRSQDIFARWGGEEFIVCLPCTDIDNACIVAEKVRSAVERSPYPGVGEVTVSIGVAQYREGEDMNDWIKRADIETYKAKKRGRNCISGDGASAQYLTISWLPAWESGNPVIDRQHKELLDYANHFLESSLLGVRDEKIIMERFDKLLGHIIEHFRQEEEILSKVKYMDLERHKGLHRDLTEKAVMLRTKVVEQEMGITDAIEFIIRDILTEHLIAEDAKFFPSVGKI